MMNKALFACLFAALPFIAQAEQPTDTPPRDGEVRHHVRHMEAWDADNRHWESLQDFWEHYAARPTGKHWGESTEYPSYSEVNEHDTLMLLTPAGRCLMEFYHQRWRRANDVRRWDPIFTEYQACPSVFD